METKRHIHMIYRSSDGKIHCEQYPVVYRNKHYIYYKRPGHDQLDYISHEPRESITFDDIDVITVRLSAHKWMKVVTWSISDSVRDALIHNMYASNLADLYSELEKCEACLADAERKCEQLERNRNYYLSQIQSARRVIEGGKV